MEDEILNLEESASLLKVSKATIRRWVKRGKLIAFKVGREYRLRRTDISKQFKKQEYED